MHTHPPGVDYPALTNTLWNDHGTPQPFGLAAQGSWLASFFRGTLYTTESPNPRMFDLPAQFQGAQDASHNRPTGLSAYAQQAYTKQQGYGEAL